VNRPVGLERPATVGAGAAPHGHEQERGRPVGRQLLSRKPRAHRHAHAGDELREAARRSTALPCCGRFAAPRVDQPLGRGTRHALLSGELDLNGIRSADARGGAALRLAQRARQADAGRAALLPGAEGGGDDGEE
jgi:hypothetical protein